MSNITIKILDCLLAHCKSGVPSCQNEGMILEISGFWHPNVSISVRSDLWLTGRCNAAPEVSLTDCKLHCICGERKKKKKKSQNDWEKNIQWMLYEPWWIPNTERYPTVLLKCCLTAELVLRSTACPVWGCNCQGQCPSPAFEQWQGQWRVTTLAKPCCRNIPSLGDGRWAVPNPTAGVKRFWAQHKRLCNNNKSIHTEPQLVKNGWLTPEWLKSRGWNWNSIL